MSLYSEKHNAFAHTHYVQQDNPYLYLNKNYFKGQKRCSSRKAARYKLVILLMIILNILAATLTPILMRMHLEKKAFQSKKNEYTSLGDPVDSVEIINKIDKSIPDDLVDFDYFWKLFDFEQTTTIDA